MPMAMTWMAAGADVTVMALQNFGPKPVSVPGPGCVMHICTTIITIWHINTNCIIKKRMKSNSNISDLVFWLCEFVWLSVCLCRSQTKSDFDFDFVFDFAKFAQSILEKQNKTLGQDGMDWRHSHRHIMWHRRIVLYLYTLSHVSNIRYNTHSTAAIPMRVNNVFVR